MIILYPSSLLIRYPPSEYTDYWGSSTQTILLDSKNPVLNVNPNAEYICIFMELYNSELLKKVVTEVSSYLHHTIKDYYGQI